MIRLVQAFWQICLLRMAPQDLPASSFLLVFSLAAHYLLGVMLYAVSAPLQQALLASAIGTGLLVIFAQSLLMLRGYATRSSQTLTALAGTDVVLGMIALPLTLIIQYGNELALIALLWFGLVIWSVVITAHILRHALSLPMAAGVALSIAYLFVTVAVMESIFPSDS